MFVLRDSCYQLLTSQHHLAPAPFASQKEALFPQSGYKNSQQSPKNIMSPIYMHIGINWIKKILQSKVQNYDGSGLQLVNFDFVTEFPEIKIATLMGLLSFGAISLSLKFIFLSFHTFECFSCLLQYNET